MGAKVFLFVLGLAVGGAATALVLKGGATDSPERSERKRVFESTLEKLKVAQREAKNEYVEVIDQKDKRIRHLEDEIESLKESTATPIEQPAPSTAVPTEKELEEAFGEFAANFQRMLVGGDEKSDAARARMLDVLERGGKPLMDRLIAEFRDATIDMGRRTILAHVLGQSAKPEAIETLTEVLRDPDATMWDLRFASHALAFSPAEGLEPFLTERARNLSDEGARANLAFGLAQRGVEEGVQLYFEMTDAVFERKDPVALVYMSGFALMGEKALPSIRERLLTYKEKQAVLVLIEIVKGHKDKESVEALEKLAYDSSRSIDIQKAAQAALQAIREADQ